MKHFVCSILVVLSVLSGYSQQFKYAFVSDTHIGTPKADEDLRRTVNDINLQQDIAFTIVTGDITEFGSGAEIRLAKEILSGLKKPWYVVPGNHDTGWSESGGVDFIKEFGYDKFTFDHNGYRFIGCASGPYVRMSDGHIPRDAIVWMDKLLKSTPKDMPVIFVNHYPLDNGLDNWYEVIDRLKKYNIRYAICGHGHSNKALDFEGIPATMGRSNLRAKDSIGGYNLVTMNLDSAFFALKRPGSEGTATWRKLPLKDFENISIKQAARPGYELNATYPQAQKAWTYHSSANVVLTPASDGTKVFIGNSKGEIEALSLKNGRKIWTYVTEGAIYSSPAVSGNLVVLGSGDGNIYALNTTSGKLVWKFLTGASVLGAPVIEKDRIYIGGSDGGFHALDLLTGKPVWSFTGVQGQVAGTPLVYDGKVYFGSWGTYFYALDKETGTLQWKWNNGSANRMFSPAMCTPVANKGIVYIVAPDKAITALSAETGKELWRNKDASVRESIGISADGETIYAKTMNDEIAGFKAGETGGGISWRLNLGFGYEHVPSMLIEKEGQVFFGTKNGVIYAFDPAAQKKLWAHKIDNAMVNTVNVLNKNTILAASMDGVVTLIRVTNVR